MLIKFLRALAMSTLLSGRSGQLVHSAPVGDLSFRKAKSSVKKMVAEQPHRKKSSALVG
jgi:hypothetical protein